MTSARCFAIGITLLLVGSGCASGRNRRGHGWFGWASVPACQSAVRARALSEFGHKTEVDFEGVADEKELERNRVRVTGEATIERPTKGPVQVEYECVTNTRRSELVSATYHPARGEESRRKEAPE